MNYFTILGLMSGTSMDGINGSIVKTDGEKITRMGINEKVSFNKNTKLLFDNELKNNNFHDKSINPDLISAITLDHARLVKKIIKTHKITPDYVGFHGQTLYHDPSSKISLQIGNPKLLANITKIKVIADFRSNDIANGGEGAPLAPIYHKNIIDSLNLIKPSCLINIGGITNTTYWDGQNLIGFDVGPGNHFLDKFCQENLYLKYDKGGNIASKGLEIKKITNQFLKDPYFTLSYPKSLDKLHFNKIYENIKINNYASADLLNSLTSVVSKSIIQSLNMFPRKVKLLIIMGGGSYNNFLVDSIRNSFSGITKTADEIGLNGDFIETELISFLAARYLNRLPTTFPSTTGVKKPTIGGQLYYN